MKLKKNHINFTAISAAILLSGCATIVNDPNIPLAFSFSDGSSGECTFKNKRGVWPSPIPTQGVMIRRSDDALGGVLNYVRSCAQPSRIHTFPSSGA